MNGLTPTGSQGFDKRADAVRFELRPTLFVAPKARVDRFRVLPAIQNGEDFDSCARQFVKDRKREPL